MQKLISCLFLFVTVSAELFSQTALAGRWKSVDSNRPMEIEIFFADDRMYHGKVVNNKQIENNGKLVLQKLVQNKDGRTFTGIMKPPDAGVGMEATVTLESADRMKIVVKKMFISKTLYLTRIEVKQAL